MKIYSSFDEYLQDNPATRDVPKVVQVSYADHLRYWQEIVNSAMLDAKNAKKSIDVQLQSKVATKHDWNILNNKISALSRVVYDIQSAVKWYETQLLAGQVVQPSGAVEQKHHVKFLSKAENYWKALLSECYAYDKKIEPMLDNIEFKNWTYANHPLTHR
jgi:hypothetical protein